MEQTPKHWMVRFSNKGVSYDGFKWNPIGEWTIAPDWYPAPVCGGGLHGQGEGGWGYCQSGRRFELCEIENFVIVDGDKVKCQKAKIIAIDKEAWGMLLELTNGNFLGSLDLRRYNHPLPEGFTHCGGYPYLGEYNHPLPKGFKQVNIGE